MPRSLKIEGATGYSLQDYEIGDYQGAYGLGRLDVPSGSYLASNSVIAGILHVGLKERYHLQPQIATMKEKYFTAITPGVSLPLIGLRRRGGSVEYMGVWVVGGLFQGLYQVLSVFRVYTPQGSFTDTLKTREEKKH